MSRRDFARLALGSVLGSVLTQGCVGPSPCRAPVDTVPSPCIAVVRGDYGSSAIAFADCDGTSVAPSWIDSGSVAPQLVTAVSADVVIVPAPGGLAWIDRYNVDVLTVADPTASPPAFTQIDVRSNVDGVSANPHDAEWLADGRALVTRYGAGPSPEGGVANDDVLVMRGEAIEARIAFDDARTTGLRADGTSVAIYARPDELVLLGASDDVALVSLGRASLDYFVFAEGMIGVLGLGEGAPSTSTLPIDGLVNCGMMRRDPDVATRAYLLCAGPLLTDAATRRGLSGVVELELVDGRVEVTSIRRMPETFRVATGGLVPLGDRRVLVVATGSAGEIEIGDQLLVMNVADGSVTLVYEASSGFVLGSGALVPSSGEVFVPDAEAGALRVIDAASATPVRTVPLDGCVGLPPRQVVFLR